MKNLILKRLFPSFLALTTIFSQGANAMESESKQFLNKVVSVSNSIGVEPEVVLAVMLFETGGTLSAWYTSGGEAFGLLQWTRGGCEPVAVQKSVGINTTPTAKEKTRGQAYDAMKSRNRLEQLDSLREYYLYWYREKKTTYAGVKDPYTKHYILTLAPNGGPNYVDGNGTTAAQLTGGGSSARAANFTRRKQEAKDMLSGKIPVPNDSQKPQRLLPSGLKAYREANGSEAVVPTTGTTPTGTTPTGTSTPGDKQKSIEDLLPVKLQFTIPEYPALVNLKAGDVILLPESSQLRDWLVTRVERTFSPGLNQLSVSANRPLNPALFVQSEVAKIFPKDIMRYYYRLER